MRRSSASTALLAWKAGRQRIDGLEDDVYENLYRGFFRFDNITGHRDVGATLCPGRKLEAKLAAVRGSVAANAGRWPAQVVDIPGVVRTERGAPAPATAPTTAPATTAAPTDRCTDDGRAASAAGHRRQRHGHEGRRLPRRHERRGTARDGEAQGLRQARRRGRRTGRPGHR